MIVHVLRKPLVGTVASNALAHGAGALNIDGCRIGLGSEVLTGGGGKLWSHYRDGTEDRAKPRVSNVGRWPANLILKHLPECEQVGVKTVRAKQLTAGCRTVDSGKGWGVQSGGDTYVKGTGASFAGDGTETVSNWQCAEGCPVSKLDEQSGVSQGTGGQTSGNSAFGQNSGWNTHTNRPTTIVRQNDMGGASRFFQQVTERK